MSQMSSYAIISFLCQMKKTNIDYLFDESAVRGADLMSDPEGNKILWYPIGETGVNFAVICTKNAQYAQKVRWTNVYHPKAHA